MVRRYDPSRPVPADVLTRVLSVVPRAPSAGFSQGCDVVVLTEAAERDTFWQVTTENEAVTSEAGGAEPGRRAPQNAWLRGMRTAPVLVIVCADKDAYLDRYTEPDKGWTDRDEARWPVPYWDVDAGMVSMLVLLAAVDAGLGACFFGVPPDRWDAVRTTFGIPPTRRLVGVVSLGHAAEEPRQGEAGAPGVAQGSPSRRAKRAAHDVVHHHRW